MRLPLHRVAILVLALCGNAAAKPPTIERLFPAGGERGTTVAVTATGSFDHWPAKAWASEPTLEIVADKAKGKLSIKIAAETPPGRHWIRLHDEEGATALRPFVVGTIPEIVETESKEAIAEPVPAAVTINGRLGKRRDVDDFAIRLTKGQTLVASVDAHHALGSPMDAVLQVASDAGFVLGQNDDDRGFDPRLAFRAPADGTYHVRLFGFPEVANANIGFAGGDSFVYRLTLTTQGFLDYAYPLAAPCEDDGRVRAQGWNLSDETRTLAVALGGTGEIAVASHPKLANAVEVRLVPHGSVVEQEPNARDHPQAVEVPVTISGRIDPARDEDVFEFSGKKQQPLLFQIEAREIGSPLDPVLRITDAGGKQLIERDDSEKGRDVTLTFTPSADGKYRAIVRDLHGHGGDRAFYRLTVATPLPDFALSLAADQFVVTPGKALSVPVTIERKHGFAEVVEVQAVDLPEGVECALVRSEPKGKTAKEVTLSLTSKRTTPESAVIRVVGKSAGASPHEHLARIPIAGFDATTSNVWLTANAPKTEDSKAK